MKTSDLRILFVVDAIQGRNGVGTYYQDLVAQLRPRVAHAELVAPRLDSPHPCQGRALTMPGDRTQHLYLPRLRALTRLVVDRRPDVIVVPGPGLFSLAACWIAARLGIPVCVTHQTDYRQLASLYWRGPLARLAQGLLQGLNLWMFRHAAAVATISEPMLAQLRALGVVQPQLVGTPLAPPFLTTPVIAPGASIRRILFVGRLAAEKQLDRFLALSAARPDLVFTVVGEGPLRPLVEQHVRRQRNLVCLGWCGRETVVLQVDAHDLLILPSAVEAFGTVALEAMARRRLVMVSPACGINDWPALADGLFVMAPGESLEQALARLEAEPVMRRGQRAARAEEGARAINEQCLGQWLQVLALAAASRPQPARPRSSPAFALLRRLALNAGN